MARTKAERWAEIHAEAMQQFEKAYTTAEEERQQCYQDRRFYSIAGAQWEGNLEAQFANKPRLEVNKVHLSVIRIFNEYRNNRITVDFVPTSAKSDDLADVCDGLYRADEDCSNAQEAYDNAFEEGVGGGIGAFRLRAEYEDEEDPENERQKIRIEPIYDADISVFFDVNAKRQDKRDAKHCFVINSMDPELFKATYGRSGSSLPRVDLNSYDWFTPDYVYFAEYYVVEEARVIRVKIQRIDGTEEKLEVGSDDFEEKLQALLDAGGEEVGRRTYKVRKVRKYILDGKGILEDAGRIAGKWIPIVPFYGKRWFINSVERCMGHVRLVKDAQRLKNMQLSKLAEISALSSVEKPIVTPEQIAGHETTWAQDNIKNFAFLPINKVAGPDGTEVATGPVGYTRSPQIPPALAALLAVTEQDISDLLGNQQAGEEMKANTSGKLVELIQNRLDMQAFIYMDNFAKAMKRAGEIWLSMAKDVYVEEDRNMKVINEDETIGYVTLNPSTPDGVYNQDLDISKASYEVRVDVGPTSSSRRASTVRALTAMMAITTDPATLDVLGSAAMMNMEGEGIGDIRAYFRKKLVRMGVIKPTDQEQRELQAEAEAAAQSPDPNSVYLQAAAQNEAAKAQKALADTALTVAKTEESRATTAKTLADINSQNRSDFLDAVKALNEAQQELQTQPLGA